MSKKDKEQILQIFNKGEPGKNQKYNTRAFNCGVSLIICNEIVATLFPYPNSKIEVNSE
jgi:hypothetical protein